MLKDKASFRGEFILECYRRGMLLWVESTHNLLTDEGLNRLLNVMLHTTTQTATWYCCIVETDTAPAAGMTYDVPVYTECTAYGEATRPAYNEALSTAKSTTNSANKATFTINAAKTIYGASLVSLNTKGNHVAGADNVLFCYAKLDASHVVANTDVLYLTYTLTATDDGV